ncbi:hypothetical protein [Citrobacter amalonaticus]|uniref:hypothetical protein n=1 Tax=Citrobacter amalonaticus TaxID=35703 RepID=UPI00397A3C8A
MKKLVFILGLITATASHAGPFADAAKAKFESEMTQAIQALDATEANKNKVIASLPQTEKALRGFVRDGLKEKKSCLKIKRDFIAHEKSLPPEESSGSTDFDEVLLSAAADYIATVCLDMK